MFILILFPILTPVAFTALENVGGEEGTVKVYVPESAQLLNRFIAHVHSDRGGQLPLLTY